MQDNSTPIASPQGAYPETPNPAGDSVPLPAPSPTAKSKKPLIIGIAIAAAVVIAGAAAAAIIFLNAKPTEPTEPGTPTETFIYKGKELFMVGDYEEASKMPEAFVVRSRDDISNYFGSSETLATEISERLDDFDFNTYSYAILRVSDDGCQQSVVGIGITSIENHEVNALIEKSSHCGLCAPSYTFYAIPFEDNSSTTVKTETRIVSTEACDPDVVYKPVIYLYPTKTTDVTVKLGAPEKLLVSYPQYTGAWRISAKPDGSLTDLSTGRGLYSLYYEADNTVSHGIRNTGFVVKGSDAAAFFEERLAQLGLNDREAEEFIIYWLPILQDNAYNYIYFESAAETATNMPLVISPAPDTVIRFTMEYAPLDAPIAIKEQKLPAAPERKGFTVVEWGGTILH